MRNLTAFILQHIHWLVFILLEVASVTLLFKFNAYQGSVWLSSANIITGKALEIESKAKEFFSLREKNEFLTQRNIVLEMQNNTLQNKLIDIAQAKDTAFNKKGQMPLLLQYKLIPAKVIDNSINKPNNLITINKGEVDGVRINMGVACGNGVVGIVLLASKHYSVVLPVLNSRSSISCAIKGRGYFGYLKWNGGAVNKAYVDDIPRHARFRKGDSIVTSGYSSVFPPGILAGKITKIMNSANGLSYKLEVELSTDFSKLRDVCVLFDDKAQERIQLLKAAQDTISSLDEKK